MPTHHLATVGLVCRLSLKEAMRRRALAGVGLLSATLLALYGFAAAEGMDAARRAPGTVTVDVIGATLLGTAAFTGLLLGGIVAVALSHSAVRGDAESGLLQPMLVRPVARAAVVLGRMLAAVLAAGIYTWALWLGAVALLRIAGDWSPAAWAGPGLALVSAVALLAIAAVAISTVLPAMAAGAVSLMLLGVGFTAGLVAQLGDALGLRSLDAVADVASLVLPFEGLYRHVLASLSSGLGDLASVGVAVGPFGGAQAMGPGSAAWTVGWAAALTAFAMWRAHALDA